MNVGIISSRYATALLRYVQETGGGERVCAQARELLRGGADMKSVRLEPELSRFVELLLENGRLDMAKLCLAHFVRIYCKSAGIKYATLVSARKSPGLEERITGLLEKQTGCRVLVDSSVDPALIGGFTLEVEDYILDASVSSQLDSIRRQFVTTNNRIV